ncbi:MAG: preprotein translocase subunit SecE [Planctomycetaceae bacterium]|nr:preprotein translocase subunit SecE [Planctomycetaceae bacterium]
MSKAEKNTNFMSSLVGFGQYKRNQGRWSRLITSWAVVVLLFAGAWVGARQFSGLTDAQQVTAAFVLLIPIAWFGFRLTQYPRFADFLIAVEAEMAKVSWPGKLELKRSTVVVITTMVLLAMFLLASDLFWQYLLQFLGVLKGPGQAS